MDFSKTKKKKKKKKDIDELVAEEMDKKCDKNEDSKYLIRFYIHNIRLTILYTFLFKFTCLNDGQWNFESGKGFDKVSVIVEKYFHSVLLKKITIFL